MSKSKKAIFSLAMAMFMLVGSLAYFTDRFTQSANLTTGTLKLDVSINGDSDNLLPGQSLTRDISIRNAGTIGAVTRVTAHMETDDYEEFGDNATLSIGSTSVNTFNQSLIVSNGVLEADAVEDLELQISLNTAAQNILQNRGINIYILVEGRQAMDGTDEAAWTTVKSQTIKMGNKDISVVPGSGVSFDDEDMFRFEANEGIASIVGFSERYIESGVSNDLVIPDEIADNKVTAISRNAFMGRNIATLTLPETLVTIDDSAFNNNAIKSVALPEAIETIGVNAFNRNGITKLEIPSTIQTVGASAFANNPLSKVDIDKYHNTVTIPATAFPANSEVEYKSPYEWSYSAYSDNTVVIYGYNDDYQREGTEAVIPSAIKGLPVTSISSYNGGGKGAFEDAGLTSVVLPDTLERILSNSFKGNDLTSVVIPNSVTLIESGAFENNKLTSVTLSNRLRTIESAVFKNNKLTSIVIPSSVTEIQSNSFEFNELSSLNLPSSVAKIGANSFASNRLTNLSLGNTVTTVNLGAFSNNRLTSVTLSSSLETIEPYVFMNNELTSIVFPDSVKNIQTRAFNGNPFSQVSIPNSVKVIEDYAFGSASVSAPINVTIDNSSDGITVGPRAFSFNNDSPAANITYTRGN